MDRLSSCYFCGAALDASLSEYPVVPKRLQTESTPEKRVTLCPTCRRKLAAVLTDVVAAADAEDQSDVMDESGMAPQPDPMDVGDANETVEAVERDEPDATLLDDEEADDADADGLLDDTEPSRQEADADRAHPMAAAEDTDDGDVTSESAAETTETETRRQNGPADTGTQADAGTDGPSLTRLEYSKVMRLLQNRQLPVPRDEIREVALNAYDIEPEEFDAIIDAAVERGLIGEANGQFVEAE